MTAATGRPLKLPRRQRVDDQSPSDRRLTEMNHVLLLVICMSAVAVQGQGLLNFLAKWTEQRCSDDYQPCTCQEMAVEPLGIFSTYEESISCSDVPVEEIQSVFSQASIRDRLVLSGGFTHLPADLLADKRVKNLAVDCQNSRLESIDADALRSSRSSLQRLRLANCDLSPIDWTFLTNFTALSSLSLVNVTLPDLQSMPHLPNLKRIILRNFAAFNGWYPPQQTPLLNGIRLVDGPIGDADAFFDAIAQYNGTLVGLWMQNNSLTAFPSQVKELGLLRGLDLSFNDIAVLSDVVITSNLRFLSLSSSGIETIQPGAFQGDFSSTRITLQNEKMKTFPGSVFQDLLQSMKSTRVGFIDIESTRIDCDCSLAWLIRDNRHLMSEVISGVCTNGTVFRELDPDGYTHCPSSTQR